jgi:RNA polymerase sigma-70 factor (ECF subfamily)
MDDELISRAIDGDGEAMRTLYQRHAPRVYAVVRRLAGSDEQAEDWAQETWLRAFRGLAGFRGDSLFTSWIHRIAVNTALHGRRIDRQRNARILEVETLPERSARQDQPLLRLQLDRAIDQLPNGMRQILVLHDVQGFTHHEIAELLGINPGTCKSQLFKARARLRNHLQPARERLEGEEVCSI